MQLFSFFYLSARHRVNIHRFVPGRVWYSRGEVIPDLAQAGNGQVEHYQEVSGLLFSHF
jgi:hypothetical protein